MRLIFRLLSLCMTQSRVVLLAFDFLFGAKREEKIFSTEFCQARTVSFLVEKTTLSFQKTLFTT